MLARKQELNTQLQQLIDALLLAVSLWVACVLRFYATSWFRLAYMVDPFRNYQWLFVVIVPFGPIMLDLQGFYQSPLYLYIRRPGGHGGFREPVLLAGTPEDIAALEQSFSPEQKTLVEVVDRIDITRQPISALVERMRHAVSRVIFAVGHTQLNKVEEVKFRQPPRRPFARRIWPKCRTRDLPVRRAELFSGSCNGECAE